MTGGGTAGCPGILRPFGMMLPSYPVDESFKVLRLEGLFERKKLLQWRIKYEILADKQTDRNEPIKYLRDDWEVEIGELAPSRLPIGELVFDDEEVRLREDEVVSLTVSRAVSVLEAEPLP